MLREKTGMSVEEFADTLIFEGYKLHLGTYYNWEAGRSSPPLVAMPLLAKALKLKSVRMLFPQD